MEKREGKGFSEISSTIRKIEIGKKKDRVLKFQSMDDK